METTSQQHTSYRPWESSDGEDESSRAKTRPDGPSENGQMTAVSTPVKRACNECRQQKLRCDAVRSPFTPCSRCRRLGKNCVVETVFKRSNKRDQFAAMQREIDDLRRRLQLATGNDESPSGSVAIAAPPDLAPPATPSTTTQRLGEVSIDGVVLDDLFKLYFDFYHPFLPFLDPEMKTDQYFKMSSVLAWSIVLTSARRFKADSNLFSSLTPEFLKLLWLSIAEMPTPYHVVKALCLICFWPLPTAGGTFDSTYKLSGIMIQIAIQNMLHFPFRSPAPNEPKTIKWDPRDRKDRLVTWIACNIVAESTCLVLGLPPPSSIDWMPRPDSELMSEYQVPADLLHQIKISQFCNSMIKDLYCNPSDPSGLIPEAHRTGVLSKLREAYAALKATLHIKISPVAHLHLLAAGVHLNAFTFFLPESPTRHGEFLYLYNAICDFLNTIMDYQTTSGTLLEHCSLLISRTIFPSGFALMKLLNSPFASNFDISNGKTLLFSIILAAKSMSLQKDDLSYRFANWSPSLWREMGAGAPWSGSRPDPLFLTVQFGMNCSHVYDCMWLRRESVREKETSNQPVTSGPGNSMAPYTATVSSFGHSSTGADSSFAAIDMETLDVFNSMDWMLGDWTDIPIETEAFTRHSNLP